ncbi:hypothetical protein IMSAG013_00745 [Clostridiales bacterium]|nr:hypothetical protein IMSAG013_00745 [Clostridiales bacterium]
MNKFCRRIAICLTAVLVLPLLAGCSAQKSNNADDPSEFNSKVVVTTEHFSVSHSMMEYFFNSYYRNFANDYAARLSQMNLDTGKSLKNQKYSDEYSWFDYLLAQTLRQVQQLLYLNEAALESDLELSEDDRQKIDDTLARYDATASENETSTAYYLKNLFGDSVNETTVRKCLELQMLAAGYNAKLEEEQSFTDAQMQTYFEENSKEYTMIGLIRAVVPSEDVQSFADAENEHAFVRLLENLWLEQEPDLAEEELAEKLEDAYVRRAGFVEKAEFSQWAFDSARKPYETYIAGDKTENDETTVYMLLPAADDSIGQVVYRDSTPLKNLKYILFQPEKNETAEACAQRTQEKFDKWQKEGRLNSEAAFDALVQEYDGDTSLALERGQLIGKLEEWIFDVSRKEGDTSMITADEGTYVLYMLSDGEPQWKSHVREDMLQEALDAALEKLAEQYDARYSESALYDISQIYIK